MFSKALLICTHMFYGELEKIIPELLSNISLFFDCLHRRQFAKQHEISIFFIKEKKNITDLLFAEFA